MPDHVTAPTARPDPGVVLDAPQPTPAWLDGVPVPPPAPGSAGRGRVRAWAETVGLVGRLAGPRRELRLRADDGVTLAATWLPGPAAEAPAVVLVHGFGAHRRKPSYAYLAETLRTTFGVLTFDQRGHGASDGRSTLGTDERRDVAVAVDAARASGAAWVALVGVSMGATSVLHAVDHGVEVDAVVTVSAPGWLHRDPRTAPVRRLAALWEHPLGRLALAIGTRIRVHGPDGWTAAPHPVEVAGRLSTPLLVVHGADDAYVDVDEARELAAAADGVLWESEGFGHAEDGFDADFATRLTGALRHVHDHERFPSWT